MFNKTLVVGNVGRGAEAKSTEDGKKYTVFTMASNRKYNKDGVQMDEATWYRVITWGGLAEICERNVKKRMRVFVEGRLQADPNTGGPRIWYDENEEPRASFELVGLQVIFMNTRAQMEELAELGMMPNSWPRTKSVKGSKQRGTF